MFKSFLETIGLANKEESSESSESSLSSDGESSSSSSDGSTSEQSLTDREFERGDVVEAKIGSKYKPCDIIKYDYGKGFVLKFHDTGQILYQFPRERIRSVREETLVASNAKFDRGDRVEAKRPIKQAIKKKKKKLTARQALLRKHRKTLLHGKKARKVSNDSDSEVESADDEEGSESDSSDSDSSDSSSSASGSSSGSSSSSAYSSSVDEEEMKERQMAINKNREKEDPDYKWSLGTVLNIVPLPGGALAYNIRWKGGYSHNTVAADDVRVTFRKGDSLEGKLEGWAEYYHGVVLKYHRGDNTYDVEFEDGEIGTHVERKRLREVGDTKDYIGRVVSDEYQQKRREYVLALKSRNYSKMLKMIIEDGIHPDHEDPLTGTNALVRACLSGKDKWAAKFIEEGADVNYQTLSGLTPLIACAERGSLRCCKAVMFDPFDRPLANPWKKNRVGKTAWDAARENKKQNIIDYLDEVIEYPGYKDALENYTICEPSTDLVKQAERAVKKAAYAAERALKNSPVVRNRAATTIQTWIRKIMSRRRFQKCVEELIRRRRRERHKKALEAKKMMLLSKMALRVQKRYRLRIARRRAAKLRQERDAAMLLQRLMLRMISRKRARKRMEREHQEFLNYCATKIQKIYRGWVAYVDYNKLCECVIVVQMMWRGREGRDKYWRELLRKEREREFNQLHMEAIERMEKTTRELKEFSFFEKARIERHAASVIEKYFCHWLFLMQRESGAIQIQRAWRGFVARHIAKVLKRLNDKRFNSLNKCLVVDSLRLRMSPKPKQKPKWSSKKLKKSLKQTLSPSPSLERIRVAGLDAKLIRKMTGESKSYEKLKMRSRTTWKRMNKKSPKTRRSQQAEKVRELSNKIEDSPPPPPQASSMSHSMPQPTNFSPFQLKMCGKRRNTMVGVPGSPYLSQIKKALTKLEPRESNRISKGLMQANIVPSKKKRKGPSLVVKRTAKTTVAKHRKNRRKAAMAQRWKREFSKLENKQKKAESLAMKYQQNQERKKIKEWKRATKLTDTSHVDNRTAYEVMEGSSLIPVAIGNERTISQKGAVSIAHPIKSKLKPSSPLVKISDAPGIQEKQMKETLYAPERVKVKVITRESTKKKRHVRKTKMASKPQKIENRGGKKNTIVSNHQRNHQIVEQSDTETPIQPVIFSPKSPVDNVDNVDNDRIQTPETSQERTQSKEKTMLQTTPSAPMLRLQLVKSDTAEEDRITPREHTVLKPIHETSVGEAVDKKKHLGNLPAYVDVHNSDFTIGRAPHNSLQLDSIKSPKMLSKVHAKIEVILSKDGKLPIIQVRDMKSTNGTYVNEKRVRSKPVQLSNGALLKLGRRRTSDLVFKVIIPNPIEHFISKLGMYRSSSPIGKKTYSKRSLSPSRAHSPLKTHRKKLMLRSRGSMLAGKFEFPSIASPKIVVKTM